MRIRVNNLKVLVLIVILFFCFNLNGQIVINKESNLYFSPNGDNVSDSADIFFTVKGFELEVFGLMVFDSHKNIIASIKKDFFYTGESTYSISWDGKDFQDKVVKEGVYNSVFYTVDKNNNKKENKLKIIVDITPPKSVISKLDHTFSPNFDGIKDNLLIKQSGTKEDLWIGEITDIKGKVIRKFSWKSSIPKCFSWDGLTNFRRKAANGVYAYTLFSVDKAGNSSPKSVIKDIELDGSSPKVKISLDNNYISPNGDGIKDSVVITTRVSSQDKVIRTLCLAINDKSKEKFEVPLYNGKYSVDKLNLTNGFYTIILSVEFKNGYKALDSTRLNINNEISNVKTNLLISGEELIVLNNTLPYDVIYDKWRVEIYSKSGTLLFKKDGSDRPESNIVISSKSLKRNKNYTITFTISDKNGNNYIFEESFLIKRNIAIVNRHGALYFDLLPIEFKPYAFKITKNNLDSINKLVVLLNKYADISILIESHVYDDGTDIEKLQNLSRNRAQSVKSELVKSGIDPNRLKLNPSAPTGEVNRNVYLSIFTK